LVAFDVSGSMEGIFRSIKNLRELDSIVKSIYGRDEVTQVKVILGDTQIVYENEFTHSLYDLRLEEITLGGGGTCTGYIKRYCSENDISEVHFITDGYVPTESFKELETYAYIVNNGINIPNVFNKNITLE
jgi:hypothetical protein